MRQEVHESLPRNQRRVIIPAKFLTATPRIVREPKHAIRMGNTVAGPNFFPNIAIGGAKIT